MDMLILSAPFQLLVYWSDLHKSFSALINKYTIYTITRKQMFIIFISTRNILNISAPYTKEVSATNVRRYATNKNKILFKTKVIK